LVTSLDFCSHLETRQQGQCIPRCAPKRWLVVHDENLHRCPPATHQSLDIPDQSHI